MAALNGALKLLLRPSFQVKIYFFGFFLPECRKILRKKQLRICGEINAKFTTNFATISREINGALVHVNKCDDAVYQIRSKNDWK